MDDSTTDLAGGDGVSIHAGFPNPAADRRRHGAPLALDLHQLLIKHPSSSYLFRVAGHHWAGQGIFDGDIAVIDRALPFRESDLVIVWENDSFFISRYRDLQPLDEPWGVITSIIHQYEH
jgi:SOS-response transcriptional repressor LexA